MVLFLPKKRCYMKAYHDSLGGPGKEAFVLNLLLDFWQLMCCLAYVNLTYLTYKSPCLLDFKNFNSTTLKASAHSLTHSLDDVKTHNPNDLLFSNASRKKICTRKFLNICKVWVYGWWLLKWRFFQVSVKKSKRKKFHNKIHHLTADESLSTCYIVEEFVWSCCL